MKRDTIIIVDDMEINRAILRGVFEKDYNLLEAENGNQALLLVEQYHSNIAAMLLDLVMPVKDGFQVMTELGNSNRLAEFPVVVITAEDSAESEVQAFDLGASDIIMKPFEPHVVKRRVQNIIELNLHKLNQDELIEEQAAKLRESNEVMIDALSSIIEYRSVETGQHIKRIRMFTKILLEDAARSYPEFGLTERNIAIIVSASSMHDIGKIAIPDSILNKPGRLTPEEFEIMKTHSIKGCEMLAGLDRMSDREYLQYAYNICRYHHERWDGKGYPDGLKGESIPVCAQVVGIADCYDALTTDRVYKKALSPEVAFNMILNGECGSFSPKLLECFKNVRVTFANLSKEYADNNLQKSGNQTPSFNIKNNIDDSLDTLQLGQMKYFTLLRYMDSTVMEVDLNTGLYHVVYLSNKDFEPLKTGSRFSESIRSFTDQAVHPDDRAEMKAFLDDDMPGFFEAGYMKKSKKCRVYNKQQRQYLWCEVTVMRIDTGHPHQRKAVLIWKELNEEVIQAAEIELSGYEDSILQSLLGGVQQCLNDQGYTILHVNEGFADLIGYSEQEIQEKFNNQYINLVYPADRQELTRQVKEQLKCGNSVEVEYRVTAKDGRVLWILDKGRVVTGNDGREYFISVLIDITQSKHAQEELRLTLERHKIIMEQTNDIIFEWDIVKDQVSYSSNWEKKFGYQPIKDMASQKIPEVSHIHPEELPNLIQLINDMASGVPYKEIEFRVADINGRYRWCKIRAACQFNDLGKPFKAVGVIMDIDKEKRASQALQDKAQRDELTRLYNRSTAQSEIDSYFEQKTASEQSAFLIIDVDDFKKINDCYGHMFGDTVLQKIAEELRRIFRSEDITARIGGDEFLIFMKNIPNEESATNRAQRIIDSFWQMQQDTGDRCPISGSIGIAFSPRDGEDFEVLFQRSDIALYSAKSQGKNRYMVFDKETMNRPFGVLEKQIVANTRIDSDYDGGLDTEKI
ncbi:MAG: diguanylate cyclase [Clostridiaceae bacterium]|nr:diguanylate cyclase [Clostridiaceae bacterium]